MLPLVLAGTLAACSVFGDSTNDQLEQLTRHQNAWTERGIRSYEYDYLITGFFTSIAGQQIHLVVTDGVVSSGTYVSTGQPISNPARWPTVDSLFATAMSVATNGRLRSVQFDAALDYPTHIDIDGPPDASGTIQASSLGFHEPAQGSSAIIH
jgi:hypothetical protein